MGAAYIVRAVAAGGVVLTLAGCAGVPSGADGSAPHTTVKMANPDPTRWSGTKLPDRSVYDCKPLACPDASRVVVRLRRSPTRNPDEQALKKLANETFNASIEAENIKLAAASSGYESIKSISSSTTEFRGFPAVVVEARRLGRGKPIYIARSLMFTGNVLVDIMSISNSRDTARTNLTFFAESAEIDDHPPPQ